MSKPTGTSTQNPLDQSLLIEILDLHARGLLRMPWIQGLILLGIGLFVVPSVPLQWFLIWACSALIAEGLRAWYARAFLQRRFSFAPESVHLVFVGLAALDGAVISAGAVMFFPVLPVLHQALLGATLFALPAAGVAVSSSRYILSAYAICVLLPASITWSLLHPSQALGLAALTAAYCITIFCVSSDGEKLVRRSVIIRHERDQLVEDLEERNRQVLIAVANAERSAQARARVLAAASHDLRQPLHALSIYSAVLAANPAPETVQELSQSIDQIVRSLGSLLNGLLDLSRLSAALYVPEQQILDMQTLIRQVFEEYQQAAAQKELHIALDLCPIRMISDPVAVGRIVRNLVDNALKYTECGAIHIACRLEQIEGQWQAIISVADSGRGIEATEHERIFEEFYQIDNPGRDHGKGVGLGLAIVKRLCELIGATITLQSALGQGTSFEVRIPATLVEEGALRDVQTALVPASFSGARIFLVDDEPEILRSMTQLLRAWGIEVFTAASGEGLEQLFEVGHQPDLLMVDLRLSGSETGAELANRLLKRYGTFEVLVVTGETASSSLLQAHALGFTVLQKPIAPEVLRASLSNLLPPMDTETLVAPVMHEGASQSLIRA